MIEDIRTVIEARRDGRVHTDEEITAIAQGAGFGSVPDYQLAAWLMAAYLNPLSKAETVRLTLAMAESGERVDLTGLPKPWVDKHSTGGVGDKTSIVLLPLLASCGLTIVKMSGAGLGITGGTVDKLASIPGFQLSLSIDQLKTQARKIGVALTGQTPDLAPADKTLYGLRDVTGTVRSIPLIVSSILSKKLAGGAEIVALDVKCGSGAFMKNLEEAEELASWLTEIGEGAGLRVSASITDMSQPLGSTVGNALEVREAIAVLTQAANKLSRPTARFRELSVTLAAETLEAAGIAHGKAAVSLAEEALASGRAATKATEWIAAQGGPGTLEAVLAALPMAPVVIRHAVSEGSLAVKMPANPVWTGRPRSQAQWVAEIDAAQVGQAVVDLGGGRHRKGDQIDLSVGVELHLGVGALIEPDQPLFTVHASTEDKAAEAIKRIQASYRFSPLPVEPLPVLLRGPAPPSRAT